MNKYSIRNYNNHKLNLSFKINHYSFNIIRVFQKKININSLLSCFFVKIVFFLYFFDRTDNSLLTFFTNDKLRSIIINKAIKN